MTETRRVAPGLDQWLESGLREAFDPLLAAGFAVPPARYATHAGRGRFGGARRIFAGGATALLLTGGTAIAAAAATTGSLDTSVWGQHISQAVQTCRTELAAGEHGIGSCVSAIASSKAHGGGNRSAGSGSAGGHGQGAANPGSSSGSSAPGKSGTAPGHSGSAPGQGGVAPGPGITPPGHGGQPPGLTGNPSGPKATPPGHGSKQASPKPHSTNQNHP